MKQRLKTNPNRLTTRRAAIYVRVSSERQADKVSPQAQQDDARAYCQERGYVIVRVYADVAKYKVGKRMVEPSGTRADRPALRRLLADAGRAEFDVIVAWREDRLYRSYRPMLDVLECIEKTGVDVELVKETFDKRMMGGKVWVAKMELDAKQDRFIMGIRGRLAKGKCWNQQPKYGYAKKEGVYYPHPIEAAWVKEIWQWYADGANVQEIRRRLVLENAPQRYNSKYKWGNGRIYTILHSDCYHQGCQVMHWDGETFEIAMPILIDPDTAQRVIERRERAKAYRPRYVKYDYLGVGVTFCASCDHKAHFYTQTKYPGGKIRRKPYRQLRCTHYIDKLGTYPGCFGMMVYRDFESKLWEKVFTMLSDDALFLALVNAKIEQLRCDERDTNAEVERLTEQLNNLALERRKVITWARRELINDDDFAVQLRDLDATEYELRRELQERKLLVGNRAERLLAFANEYRTRLRSGTKYLEAQPLTDEDGAKQFEFRKRVVDEIVERVDVLSDKSVRVHFIFDMNEEVHSNDASTCLRVCSRRCP